VSAGISEALVTTPSGLFCGYPGRLDVQLFTGKLESVSTWRWVNSSSELIDYFLKRSQRLAKK